MILRGWVPLALVCRSSCVYVSRPWSRPIFPICSNTNCTAPTGKKKRQLGAAIGGVFMASAPACTAKRHGPRTCHSRRQPNPQPAARARPNRIDHGQREVGLLWALRPKRKRSRWKKIKKLRQVRTKRGHNWGPGARRQQQQLANVDTMTTEGGDRLGCRLSGGRQITQQCRRGQAGLPSARPNRGYNMCGS